MAASDRKKPREEISLDVNVENEQIVLATLVQNRELRDKYAAKIPSDRLQDPTHQALLAALKILVMRQAESEADSIVQLSGEKVTLKYLRTLERDFDALPEENLVVHLEFVERDAGRALAREPFGELYAAMDDAHSSLEDVEAAAMAVARAVRSRRTAVSEISGDAAWMDVYQTVEEQRNGKGSVFVPFHFSGLDDVMTEGRRPGRMTVLAGRPGMGKSTFVANLVLRAKLRSKDAILACPFEDGREAMVERMGCARGRVDAVKLIRQPGTVTDEEAMRFRKALRELCADGQITFADSMASIDELEAKLATGVFRLVILDLFDYLMPSDAKPQDVTEALRRIRNLSKPDRKRDWDGFHTIVCHQIRRIKRVKNPRPHLHEIKNAGGYEEVADQVFLLHRPNYYDPEREDEDILEVKIAKQRRGPMNVTLGYEFGANICRVGKFTPDYRNGTRLETIIGKEGLRTDAATPEAS